MAAETNKPEIEVMEQCNNAKHVGGATGMEMENAVGYKEYLEASNIEGSDKEALQFMDKTSLNYANLFGYQKALSLKGKEFNYLSAMVYAGYFFGQYPCGWLIGRFPAQKVLAISIFCWGFTVIIMTQARTYSTAFIMGLFEAAVTPSSLGWGGIIGSYISMGISKLPVDMSPERWELIFYILGGATCLWAIVIWIFMADSPSNAHFLNHRERLLAVKRVSGNQTGIKNKHFDKGQIVAGFTDPKTILLFISVFAAYVSFFPAVQISVLMSSTVLTKTCSAIPNGVVNSFSTIIIRDMGFSTTKTTELKSVGDAVQIIALIIGGSVILNVPNSRLLTATVANILCTIAAACMAYLPRSNTWGRLISFWLVNAQSVGFTVSLTTLSSNMAGYTHRSLASALVFTAYCWGNFAGPFVVDAKEAPRYEGATIGLLVGYSIKTGCHLALLGYMFFTNKRRTRVYGPPNKEASDEAGMRDQTEFVNKDFRYVL
ncbi:hypothetical protein GGP41_000469 [Bipolaris sorokiniana]|uniref:Major facilitator superfamily (MFS) profile domain-containing protein n=1 Tax=Cochliobolus sativus TaxID=45130 RepID=A0A8H6DXN1_COCSA|nr:hypothetical protein GGP41_000469 [Bipolaris sorokiniana]